MRYFADIDGETYEVVIDGTDRILLNGQPVAVDLERVGQDLYSLLLDHVSYETVVEPEAGQRGRYAVLISGSRYAVKVQDERARRLTAAERKAQPAGGEIAIRAPIPGLVVKVLVEPGQQVAENESLLILEAMKMENDLRAPQAGVVHDVRTAAGAQVALGQVLISIKAKAEA